MFTPRPRESEGASSPSGRDVEYEKLPPSAIPARLDSTKKMELEAEMVAVQEKILKTQKLLPDTLKWDGKSDTLDSFASSMGEWIEIRLGDKALKVFQGEQVDPEMGGASMPSCIYTTWSQELYLVVRGRLSKNTAEGKAMDESTMIAKSSIQRSVYNLLQHWKAQNQARTQLDCDALDIKIEDLKISLGDEPAIVAYKCSQATRLWQRKPVTFRGSDSTLEKVLMDLLPIQCEGWKQDYQRTIETNENLYGMGRPDYAAVVRAVQTAVLDVTVKERKMKGKGVTLLTTENRTEDGKRDESCLNCGGKHATKECPKKCPHCTLTFCGYNTCGTCPVKTGDMPPRILNANKKPIPLSLYKVVQKKMLDAKQGGGATRMTLFSSSETLQNKDVRTQIMLVNQTETNTLLGDLRFEEDEGLHVLQDVQKMCLEQGEEREVIGDGRSVSARSQQSAERAARCEQLERAGGLMNLYFPYDCFEPRAGSIAEGNNAGLLMVGDQRVCTLMMQNEAPAFEPKGSNLYVALDSGSDQHATPYKEVLRGCKVREATCPTTMGANAGAPLTVEGEAVSVPMVFETCTHGQHVEILSSMVVSSNFPCTILSQHKMWEDHGWRVQLEDVLRVTCPRMGVKLPVMRHQGLFVLAVHVPDLKGKSALSQGDVGGACTLLTRAERSHEALLWSARMGSLDGAGLAQLVDACVGHKVHEVTADMREVLKVCEVRNLGGMKRLPKDEAPTSMREAKPGALLIVDGFGPYGTPAIATGAVYILGGVDDATGLPFLRQTIQHNAQKYLEFIDVCNAETRVAGHASGVLAVRSDNAPELESAVYSEGLLKRGMAERKTPPYDKGGTARVERVFGITEPIARQLMARANLNKSFFLHAMVHAGTLLRYKARDGEKRTRHHSFYGLPADVSGLRTWGCMGWASIPPAKRDTKGGPVAAKCVWVGLIPAGWLVVVGTGAAATLEVTAQGRFYETNLLSKGVMPAATVLDASTQTDEQLVACTANATELPGETSCTAPEGSGAEAGGASLLPISLSKEPRERKQVVRFAPSLLNVEYETSAELLGAARELCVMDAAMQAMECAEGAHDYVQSAGMAWSLVARKGNGGQGCFKMVTLNGPQGEYQLAEPRNSREARLVPDSDLWYNEEVMHVSELEAGGILRPVERHEAEGRKIYPSQIDSRSSTHYRRTRRTGPSRSARCGGVSMERGGKET